MTFNNRGGKTAYTQGIGLAQLFLQAGLYIPGRLSEIFKSGSSNSLVLLNGSLSSTSHTEAIYIAKDVVKGLRLLGCKGIYNTHMHELGMMVDEINSVVNKRFN